MANEGNNIEQVFKDGFKDFEHKVSNKVWQNLDDTLFETQNVVKSKMSVLKSMILCGIPVAILISAGVLYPDNTTNSHVAEQITLVHDNNGIETIVSDQIPEVNSKEAENNIDEDFSQPQILIIEDNEGDDVEEVFVEMKGGQTEDVHNSDYQPKEMPELSDKPYINYAYYKKQSSQSYSKFCIGKLRKGVLLVRLKTREKGIAALLRSGQKKKAEKLKNEIREDNMAVVNAFRKKYNFSDVFFFYSNNSEKVRDRSFNGVFVNEELELDESITLDPSQTFYMILDIGSVKIPSDDDTKHFAPAISRALVVKDRDFEQLYRPFPFYIGASNKKNINVQVNKLNDDLESFYKSEQGKL